MPLARLLYFQGIGGHEMRHPLDYDHSDPIIRQMERDGIQKLTRSRLALWLLLWVLF